VQLEVNNYE